MEKLDFNNADEMQCVTGKSKMKYNPGKKTFLWLRTEVTESS